MLQSSVLRYSLGLPQAALVTFGLFALMASWIAQPFVQPQIEPQRIIERFTPLEVKHEPLLTERPLTELIEATPPPETPDLVVSEADINLPDIAFSAPVQTGLIPQASEFGRTPIAIEDRDIQAMAPPILNYPRGLRMRGVEGDCDVSFNVDTRGRPYGVAATCTNAGFVREAERAIRKTTFIPKVQNGQPVERRNVVYPLAFRLSD